MIKVQLVLW